MTDFFWKRDAHDYKLVEFKIPIEKKPDQIAATDYPVIDIDFELRTHTLVRTVSGLEVWNGNKMICRIPKSAIQIVCRKPGPAPS